MIIDIEHYLKIRILNEIEEIFEEDGYNIVNLYLEHDYNNKKFPKSVHNSIMKKVSNDYYKKIFSKYDINEDKKNRKYSNMGIFRNNNFWRVSKFL